MGLIQSGEKFSIFSKRMLTIAEKLSGRKEGKVLQNLKNLQGPIQGLKCNQQEETFKAYWKLNVRSKFGNKEPDSLICFNIFSLGFHGYQRASMTGFTKKSWKQF